VSFADDFKEMEKGFDFTRALAEADRCLLCHDAPCSKGCPAETEPGTFIRKLRFRNLTGAIRTIKTNNILGGACGVLCPTARLCEKECAATGIGEPIKIGKIQRFLVEHGWDLGFQVFDKPPARKQKVAVVGSGPSGLACAAELAQKGFGVTVFDEHPEPGGVLRYGVIPIRFDKRFLERELEDLKTLGVEFACGRRIEGRGGAEQLLKDGYAAVFLGPGLWAAHRLRPEAKELAGVYSSVEYLEALRKGRFDELEKNFKGKTVAVIGGGSVAMDCVRSAARLGAEDVYLVYRRSYLQMPAEEDERIEALEEGIHFLLLNQPLEYMTDKKGGVAGVKLVRTRLGQADASGRRKPLAVEGSEWVLAADAVIEAIGNRAAEDSPDWYPNLEVDDKKLIRTVDETGKTLLAGIFAGGDIVRGPGLVVEAVQDGKLAARAIMAALSEQEVS
jgi:NADPH-dependent glutamate synthase beta subunit-like oxidoreductase